jgi:hypothetical protein
MTDRQIQNIRLYWTDFLTLYNRSELFNNDSHDFFVDLGNQVETNQIDKHTIRECKKVIESFYSQNHPVSEQVFNSWLDVETIMKIHIGIIPNTIKLVHPNLKK